MSGKNWWNSAISGLESRLDGILAEDGTTPTKPAGTEAGAKSETTEKTATDKKLAVEPGGWPWRHSLLPAFRGLTTQASRAPRHEAGPTLDYKTA